MSGAASSIWHGFTSAIGDAVSGIWNALKQVWSTITGFFSGAGSWLLDAGKKILSGLIDGAKSVVGDVKNFFTSIGSDIISWKGPPSYDAVMLTGNGQLIMKGLITGIDSQTDALRSKLGQITTTVKTDLVAPRTLGQAFAAGLGPAASQGAVGGAVVHQTFTGNYLMSDSDMTKFATMVGGKVVTHLAPQGGVNLTLR